MTPDEVRARLHGSLPPPGGWPAIPGWLRPVRTDGGTIPERPGPDAAAGVAAALACVVPGASGAARIILTDRTDHGGHHSGEVALPGGRREPGEAFPVDTALREAHEEVGLDPIACGLTVVGVLETIWIPASNFLVTPVVAIAARPPDLVADPREVAAIFDAPVEAFLPDAERAIVERTVRDWPLRFGAYPIAGRLVWGATARILAQFGALLAGAA